MINNLNQYIDQTLLKADATAAEISKLVQEAKTYRFKAVCVNPTYVPFCAEQLKDSDVSVCTVVGFPLGANTTATKVFEAQSAITDGAQEIDVVLNIGALKDQKQDFVLQELQAVRKVCAKGVVLKVIIETALLTEAEKIIACKLVSQAKADFIKTSTGFAGQGATVADVTLLRKYTDQAVAIKASGGVRTQEQALAMIAAGATRIGTSNGVSIVNQTTGTESY